MYVGRYVCMYVDRSVALHSRGLAIFDRTAFVGLTE